VRGGVWVCWGGVCAARAAWYFSGLSTMCVRVQAPWVLAGSPADVSIRTVARAAAMLHVAVCLPMISMLGMPRQQAWRCVRLQAGRESDCLPRCVLFAFVGRVRERQRVVCVVLCLPLRAGASLGAWSCAGLFTCHAQPATGIVLHIRSCWVVQCHQPPRVLMLCTNHSCCPHLGVCSSNSPDVQDCVGGHVLLLQFLLYLTMRVWGPPGA
jgi:hypothetical protein